MAGKSLEARTAKRLGVLVEAGFASFNGVQASSIATVSFNPGKYDFRDFTVSLPCGSEIINRIRYECGVLHNHTRLNRRTERRLSAREAREIRKIFEILETPVFPELEGWLSSAS